MSKESYVEIFGGKLDWALPFQRTNAFPLDRSTMFASYADAVKYAAGDTSDPDSRGLCGTSYVGQVITVFHEDEIATYRINASRELEEMGRKLVGDGKSIAISGTEIGLLGISGATVGQQIRIKNYAEQGQDPDLRIEWFTPDTSDITDLQQRVETLEGDSETVGSVDYKIDQFYVNTIQENYYDKDTVDGKLTGALHYKGTKQSLSALLETFAAQGATAPSTGDVYNIRSAGGYDSTGTKIKAGDNVIFNGTGDGTDYVAKSGAKYYSDNTLQTEVGTLATDTEATYVSASVSSIEIESTTYYVATSSCEATGWDVAAGTTDLSNYYTKAEANALLDTKVDKVSGKSLVSDTEITRLAGLEAISDSATNGNITLTDKDAQTRDITVYELPIATTAALGGIKSTSSIDGSSNEVTNVVTVNSSTGAATVDYIDPDSLVGSANSAEKVDHSLTIGSKTFDGSAAVEILASDVPIPDTYVQFSDIATTSKAGVIKSQASVDGSSNHVTNVVTVDANGNASVAYIDGSTVEGSVPSAAELDHTLTVGSKTFDGSADVEITKSDLEGILTDFAKYTDYATTSKGGTLKSTASMDGSTKVTNVVTVNSSTGAATVDYVSGSSVQGTVPDSTKLGGVSASDILVADANTDLTSKVKAAAAADALATARTIGFSSSGSDASWSVTFDGSANVDAAMTLNEVLTPNAGTYTKVTVNKKGLVTDATTLEASDIPSLTLSKISDAGAMAAKNNVAESDFDSDLAAKVANWDTVTNKADAATTLAGYGITDAYTKTEVNSLVSSAFHYKGTKASFAALVADVKAPLVGDVYNISTAGGVDSHGTAIKAGDNVACSGAASVASGKTYYSDTTLETEAGTLSAATDLVSAESTYGTISVSGATYYVDLDDVTAASWDVLAGTMDLSAYKTWAEITEYTEGRYAKLADYMSLKREVLGAANTYKAPSGINYYSDTALTELVGTVPATTTATRVDNTYSSIVIDATTYYVASSATIQDASDGSTAGIKYAVFGSNGAGDASGLVYDVGILKADENTVGSVDYKIAQAQSSLQDQIDEIVEVSTGTIDTRIAAHNTDSDAHATEFAAKQNKVIQQSVTLTASTFTAASSGDPGNYKGTFTVSGLTAAKNYKVDLVPTNLTAANMSDFLAVGFLPQVTCDNGQITVHSINEPADNWVVMVTATEIQ